MPFILAAFILILDQVSKILCADLLPALAGGSFPLWNGVFHLTYVENRGAAFGMLSGAPWLLHVITGVLVLAMILILAMRYKAMPRLMRFALCMILAGALGNMIDRVFLGYVRDMLDFCLINFYVFNVADAAITVGAVLLALDILFFRGREFLQNEFASDKGGKKAMNELQDKKDEIDTDNESGGRNEIEKTE